LDLREIGLGVCGLDSTGSGQVPVTGCCECGDEPSGSCATELAVLNLLSVINILFETFLSTEGIPVMLSSNKNYAVLNFTVYLSEAKHRSS
jgi:hypothetical protein